MKQELANFLKAKGFIEIHSSLPEFSFYFHIENQYVNVIHVVDYKKDLYIARDQFDSIKGKIYQFFEEKNIPQIHILSLILASDLTKAKDLKDDDRFCWIVSKESKDLLSAQGVEDFYGMKAALQQFLSNTEQWLVSEDVTEVVNTPKKPIPFVNISLVTLNVLIFIICTFTGDLLYNKYMLRFQEVVIQGEYFRLFTSLFLHAGSQHLINNMMILLFLGNMLEDQIGHYLYLLLYLISGIGGGILSLVYQGFLIEASGSVGASGSIFGLLGILLVLVLAHKGRLEHISLSRISIVILFSIYSGFTSSNIDNAAHIGGLLTGFLATGLFYLLKMGKGMVRK